MQQCLIDSQTHSNLAAQSESAANAATLLSLQSKIALAPQAPAQALPGAVGWLPQRQVRSNVHLSGQMKPARKQWKASVAICAVKLSIKHQACRKVTAPCSLLLGLGTAQHGLHAAQDGQRIQPA